MDQTPTGFMGLGISLVDVVRQCKQIFRFPADLHGFSENACCGTYILCIL